MPAAASAQRSRAPLFIVPSGYAQHRPEATPLYGLVEQNYPDFRELRAMEGRSLPDYVQEEFDAYLKCGRLEEGFLRVRCASCRAQKLVAFSCKKRGFCPSCGGRRMAETAALLADEVLPERPLRQWALSLPYALRYLLATDPDSLTLALRTVYRAISGFLLKKAGLARSTGHPGAVTLIQRFGSALNLNIHFHMIFLDGVFMPVDGAPPVFRQVSGPTASEQQVLVQQIGARIGRVLEQRGLIERDMENAWPGHAGIRRPAGRSDRPLDHLSRRSRSTHGAETVHAADGACQGRRARAAGRWSRRGRGGRVLVACGPRHPAAPAREARTAVPLREPPADCRGATGADFIRAGALPAQGVPWHEQSRDCEHRPAASL